MQRRPVRHKAPREDDGDASGWGTAEPGTLEPGTAEPGLLDADEAVIKLTVLVGDTTSLGGVAFGVAFGLFDGLFVLTCTG